MSEESDILWKFYQEHCTWERHHESQRASVTSLLVAVAAAILGVITFDKQLSKTDVPLTLFLAMQGVFGAIFAAKHYERFCMHQERANRYRAALDAAFPSLGILNIRNAADTCLRGRFTRLSRVRLHHFWVAVHILIAVFGAILTLGIWLGWLS